MAVGVGVLVAVGVALAVAVGVALTVAVTTSGETVTVGVLGMQAHKQNNTRGNIQPR